MQADPELAAAFHALTPGRQKSYVIHLSSAKTSKTRAARIERARGKILSGKGATERWSAIPKVRTGIGTKLRVNPRI